MIFWGICFWMVGTAFFKWLLETDQYAGGKISAVTIVPVYGVTVLFIFLKKRWRTKGVDTG
jgi:hypothetical protein